MLHSTKHDCPTFCPGPSRLIAGSANIEIFHCQGPVQFILLAKALVPCSSYAVRRVLQPLSMNTGRPSSTSTACRLGTVCNLYQELQQRPSLTSFEKKVLTVFCPRHDSVLAWPEKRGKCVRMLMASVFWGQTPERALTVDGSNQSFPAIIACSHEQVFASDLAVKAP